MMSRLHLLQPLGGFVAQFPLNCSISGCKNQGERRITAAAFQVTAPMVENKHDTVWQERRFGWDARGSAGLNGTVRLAGGVCRRWRSGFPQEALGGFERAQQETS